jgi:hypothetical protein
MHLGAPTIHDLMRAISMVHAPHVRIEAIPPLPCLTVDFHNL